MMSPQEERALDMPDSRQENQVNQLDGDQSSQIYNPRNPSLNNLPSRNSSNNIQSIDDYNLLTSNQANVPIGVKFFGKMFKFTNVSAKRTFHKSLVLCITFISYCCFHIGRRPLSIVKTVLNRDCSKLEIPPDQLREYYNNNIGSMKVPNFDSINDDMYMEDYSNLLTSSESEFYRLANNSNWCDWAPFDDDATAGQLLGELDSAFLFSYAFFMFLSGYVADRCNLRYFLTAGLILGGILLYAFGLAYYLDIHSMSYLVLIQVLSGIVQTSGWPSVIACIGNWFDTNSRGSVFGIWNSNTYIGNILGAVIAGYFVDPRWGLSFMVPGFLTLISGVLVFLFLVPRPEDVHLSPISGNKNGNNSADGKYEEDTDNCANQRILDRDIEEACDNTIGGATSSAVQRSGNRRKSRTTATTDMADVTIDVNSDTGYQAAGDTRVNNEHSPLISPSTSEDVIYSADQPFNSGVSIWSCVMIPGVIEYSLCLGFAKLVSYTFLFWLPKYISQNTQNSSAESAYLSVPFDIGGIVGAIAAGYFSDRFRKSGLICSIMLLLAIPSMLLFEQYGSLSNTNNISLQLVAGLLVNGPYALITTAISADLGSRVKGGKAMATVAAILDGTGSIGAAVGPLLAGRLQRGTDSDWHNVFLMLMASDLIAILCLTRITLKELGLR